MKDAREVQQHHSRQNRDVQPYPAAENPDIADFVNLSEQNIEQRYKRIIGCVFDGCRMVVDHEQRGQPRHGNHPEPHIQGQDGADNLPFDLRYQRGKEQGNNQEENTEYHKENAGKQRIGKPGQMQPVNIPMCAENRIKEAEIRAAVIVVIKDGQFFAVIIIRNRHKTIFRIQIGTAFDPVCLIRGNQFPVQ